MGADRGILMKTDGLDAGYALSDRRTGQTGKVVART
jgi:hypothetical protein